MSKKRTARNLAILAEYDPLRRNGPELAEKYNLSEARIYQILQAQGKKSRHGKFDGDLPGFVIEQRKAIMVNKLADELGVSISSVLRWGTDLLLSRYAQIIETLTHVDPVEASDYLEE